MTCCLLTANNEKAACENKQWLPPCQNIFPAWTWMRFVKRIICAYKKPACVALRNWNGLSQTLHENTLGKKKKIERQTEYYGCLAFSWQQRAFVYCKQSGEGQPVDVFTTTISKQVNDAVAPVRQQWWINTQWELVAFFTIRFIDTQKSKKSNLHTKKSCNSAEI